MNLHRTMCVLVVTILALRPSAVCAQTAAGGPKTSVAAVPASMEEMMVRYCAAPGHNDFWCGPRIGQPRIPLAQQWEIVEGYCFDHVDSLTRPVGADREPVVDADAELCEALKKVPVPFAVIYNPETQRWKPNGAFEGKRRHDFDPDAATGKPTLYLDKNESVGVIIERLNPLAYRVERGETVEKQIPGFESIQTVLTAAGGALSAFAATMAVPPLPDWQVLTRQAAARFDKLVVPDSVREQQALADKKRAARQAQLEDQASAFLAVTLDISAEKLGEEGRAELAQIQATLEQAEIARRRQEEQRLDSAAFKSDADVLGLGAARLKAPFDALRSSIARLEHQLRRLVSTGRQLNRGVTRIGRSFDDDIERQASWTKLFDDLRSAQVETDREIGACDTAFVKFGPVVTTDPAKPTDVHSAAIDFLKELDPAPSTSATALARSCALNALTPRLRTSVLVVQSEAARVARLAKADESATLQLRLAQADARERFLEMTRLLSRRIAEFSKLKDETTKIFEKEGTVKRQAELSKMLSDRARNASMRAFGQQAPVQCAGTGSAMDSLSRKSALGMSLRLVTPHPQQLPMHVRVTMDRGGQPVPVDVLIPGHAVVGHRASIGVEDVDFFDGCRSIDSVTVALGSQTLPTSSVVVESHQGFVLTNRVFVQERVFEAALSKVWTEKVVMTLAQPEDQQLTLSAPSKIEASYDLARRRGQLFGAHVGLIYTPLVSRTFALADPTPGSTTTIKDTQPGPPVTETVIQEPKRVIEKDTEAKAGQLAAFFNIHAARRHWAVKPGVQIGFGLDTDSPSLLLGFSLEVTKYMRFGAGPAWIRSQDIRDPSLLEEATRVPAGFEIPTENKFRATWYASVSFAIDALPMFSKK